MSVCRVTATLVCGIVLIAGPEAGRSQTFEYFGERGPQHWGKLAPAWAACSTGRTQSPVDISGEIAAHKSESLPTEYSAAHGEIFNNGHTIEVETEGKNGLTLDGKRFELAQFHLHSPSEHRIAGRSYEMELHLVHRAADGQLAVVGVFLTRGASSNALRPVFEAMPQDVGKKRPLSSELHPAAFLPEKRTHYRYSGSLTTPPCSEGVQWFVLEQPMTVADDDLARFARLIPFNARPVQPRSK